MSNDNLTPLLNEYYSLIRTCSHKDHQSFFKMFFDPGYNIL